MNNHYQILQVSEDATNNEIKRSYRELAKQYHPDINDSKNAAAIFIIINEAYEVLIDPKLRKAYDFRMKYDAISKAQQERSDQIYREWVEKQRYKSRQQSAYYAQRPFSEFTKSPIYRTAMFLDNFYNYFFIILGVLMILYPIIRPWFSYDTDNPFPEQTSYFQIIIGISFTYGIYYFIFRNKTD